MIQNLVSLRKGQLRVNSPRLTRPELHCVVHLVAPTGCAVNLTLKGLLTLAPRAGSWEQDGAESRFSVLVAGVEHPHIVPLYAAESRGGLLYLVMRLLPGRTLEDRIREEGMLAPAEAARVAHEIAEALAFAHARGVVHRDIKPGNILLDSTGNATVTDFGVSLITGKTGGEQAVRGMTVGTPSYMSPEQGLGEEIDGRAFLVGRMLDKNPASRPDAGEVVSALEAARTPDGLMSPAEIQRRRRRKRYKSIGLIVGTGVVSLVAVIFFAVKAVTGVTRAMDSGQPPLLDATGAGIPDSIIVAARADGLLLSGEVPMYAFIPAKGSAADALLFTDTYIIRRPNSRPRRFDSSRAKSLSAVFSLASALGQPLVARDTCGAHYWIGSGNLYRPRVARSHDSHS